MSPSRKREVMSFLTEADLVNSQDDPGPSLAWPALGRYPLFSLGLVQCCTRGLSLIFTRSEEKGGSARGRVALPHSGTYPLAYRGYAYNTRITRGR